MDVLGVLLVVGVGLAILVSIAFFIFVAVFIFKVFRRVFAEQKEFDQRWNNDAWNRFRK